MNFKNIKKRIITLFVAVAMATSGIVFNPQTLMADDNHQINQLILALAEILGDGVLTEDLGDYDEVYADPDKDLEVKERDEVGADTEGFINFEWDAPISIEPFNATTIPGFVPGPPSAQTPEVQEALFNQLLGHVQGNTALLSALGSFLSGFLEGFIIDMIMELVDPEMIGDMLSPVLADFIRDAFEDFLGVPLPEEIDIEGIIMDIFGSEIVNSVLTHDITRRILESAVHNIFELVDVNVLINQLLQGAVPNIANHLWNDGNPASSIWRNNTVAGIFGGPPGWIGGGITLAITLQVMPNLDSFLDFDNIDIMDILPPMDLLLQAVIDAVVEVATEEIEAVRERLEELFQQWRDEIATRIQDAIEDLLNYINSLPIEEIFARAEEILAQLQDIRNFINNFDFGLLREEIREELNAKIDMVRNAVIQVIRDAIDDLMDYVMNYIDSLPIEEAIAKAQEIIARLEAIKNFVDDIDFGLLQAEIKAELNAKINFIIEKIKNWIEGKRPPAEELCFEELKKAIADANDLLDDTLVSVNGTDVATNLYWAVQAAHDALQVAIDVAEDLLDTIKRSSLTQAEVDAAVEVLRDAIEAFDYIRALGTFTPTTPPPTPVITGVSVSFASSTIHQGGSLQLTSVVSGINFAGAVPQGVVWTTNVGTISSTGLLTIPSTVTLGTVITVRATSTFNSAVFGEATITVMATPPGDDDNYYYSGSDDAGITQPPASTPPQQTTTAPTNEPQQATDAPQQAPNAPQQAVGQRLFDDVFPSDWFYDFVNQVAMAGLMNGTAHRIFAPQTNMSRAMFVQVFANLEGIDLSSYANSPSVFTDVAADAWYFNAVQWGAGLGVISGMGDGTFAPNAPVTREQMATILSLYVELRGIQLPVNGDVTPFVDAVYISYWAREGVEAIQSFGIIQGHPGGIFAPQDTATRAEVATIFSIFLDLIQ